MIHRTALSQIAKGILFVVALLFLYFITTGKSFGNHDTIAVLQNKVQIANGTCPLGKGGLMDKKSNTRLPCALLLDPDDDSKFWVVIENNNGSALWVIEATDEGKTQRVVWRLGTGI